VLILNFQDFDGRASIFMGCILI